MKKILALILCITMFASIMTSCGKGNGNEQATTTENKTEVLAPDVWNGDVASSFEKGSGSESDPYVIATSAQLAYLAKQVNGGDLYSGKYFMLTNDIDLNSIEWTSIGNGINSFEGFFDGNNKAIKNLKITRGVKYNYKFPTGKESTYYSIGLFSTIQNASIKNLIIDNAEIVVSLSDKVMYVHAGILCGGLRTYDTISNISNIKILNSKIITDLKTDINPNNLIIGGAVGHVYSTENTVTNINLIETDMLISTEKNFGSTNYIGSIIGYTLINDSSFNLENCASYLDLKISKEQYYYTVTRNFFGMIGLSQASRQPFVIKDVFSKLTINKPLHDSEDYPTAYTANAILGNAYYYALKDDPTAIGYKFENVFGCVEQIDKETNEKIISTSLYKLPDGPEFSQINCQGCETLPENHDLDTNIWDISSLESPKLK